MDTSINLQIVHQRTVLLNQDSSYAESCYKSIMLKKRADRYSFLDVGGALEIPSVFFAGMGFMTNCFEQIDKSCVTLYNKEKSLDYSVYMEEIMSKNWIDENNIDWSDRQVEEDEILSHIASLREMTVAGKIAWELISYEPPYFFIHNPFVEDMDASISQKLLVEGTAADGRTFRYRIRELINVPSGLCDIEIEEKQPSTGYETALSFDGKYEYLTSQEEVLKTYGNDSIVLFVQAVVEQLRSVNFPQMVKEPSRVFSAEPLPAEVTDLPIVQKAQELFAARNAIAFHELTLSDVLREGLGVKD